MTTPLNPFETPRPRGIRLLQGTLRVVAAAQAFGLAAMSLQSEPPLALAQLIGELRNLPPDQVAHLTRILGYCFLGAGILTLLRPATIILTFLLAAQIGQAASPPLLQVGLVPELEPGVHAVRVAIPAALLLVDFWPPRIKPTLILTQGAVTLLRLGLVVTLTSWGLVCLHHMQHQGTLLQMVIEVADRMGGRQLSTEQAALATGLAAAIQFGLAGGLLAARSRFVAALAAIWGLTWAFSPIVAGGASPAAECLQRFAEAGAPLAVLVFWSLALRRQRPQYIPERKLAAPDELD